MIEVKNDMKESFPIPSMYRIFTYIWLISMVNVGKNAIHGRYGICCKQNKSKWIDLL